MNVLVACEFSGVVRDAFTSRGHRAVSCDLEPSETVGEHYRGDVRDLLRYSWDLVIAHPPCRCLCVSGAQYWPMFEMKGEQEEAIEFFRIFTKLTCKWCIENPIGLMSSLYRKPDQVVQPWQYGHGETEATCLWLNNLPTLNSTKVMKVRNMNLTPSGQNKIGPSPNRSKERSRTYRGIAEAMANQWG